MLRIRLTRTGKRKQPHYRVVVTEKKTKRDTKFLATLGHYIPTNNPAVLKIDIKEYDLWLSKGAQPTETVTYLRTKTTTSEEIQIPKTAKTKLSKKAKAKAEAQKAEKESAEEAPKETVKPETPTDVLPKDAQSPESVPSETATA
jgi:small subunit ribosomal protein S16